MTKVLSPPKESCPEQQEMGRDWARNQATASGMVHLGDGTRATYIVDPRSIQEIGLETRDSSVHTTDGPRLS